MKTGMEHGLEMVRRFGPPFPPMMPPFAPPPPPPPAAAAAVPFTAPFPGMSRTDNSDNNNRYGNYFVPLFSILSTRASSALKMVDFL